jgi:hypothetical protein
MTEPKEPRNYLEQAVIFIVGVAIATMILVLHDPEVYKLFCELTKVCGE